MTSHMAFGTSIKNHPELSLVLVLLIALAVRLPLLYGIDVVAPDGVVLVEMARTFTSGDYFTVNVPGHHHEPLYSALIAAISALTPLDYVRSGQIASLASAMATIYLVFRLAGRFYGTKTGICSALVLSLVPLHALSSVMVLKESFYTLIAVAAVYSCALAMEGKGKGRFALAGLFLGLAYLVRLDGVMLLLLIPFLCYAVDSGMAVKVRSMLVLAATAFTLYAAYAAVLYVQTGEITISKKLNYYVTPVAAPDAAKKKLLRDYGIEEGEEIIKSGSRWRTFLLKRTEGLYKTMHHMLPSVFPALLMLFAGAGISSGLGKKEMLLLMIPLTYAFVFPFLKYPTDYRYFLCATPFLSIFAGRGFARFQHWAAERHWQLPWIFVIFVIVVFAPWALRPLFDDARAYRDLLLQKEAGLFIGGGEQKEKIKIVSPLPVVSFYAGAEHSYLGPLKKGGEIMGLLEETGADYAVLDDLKAADGLLEETRKKQSALGVEKIREFSGGGIQVIVFKVRRCPDKGRYGEIQAF